MSGDVITGTLYRLFNETNFRCKNNKFVKNTKKLMWDLFVLIRKLRTQVVISSSSIFVVVIRKERME